MHVRVLADETLGTVSPRLYGHFAEHLGRCCYDGLFVGPNSPIPNEHGFRKDALDALAAMPTPLLRWPGGCYADHYHWRDGIGNVRKRRLGMSCGERVLDTNELGTHEFLWLCERIGAEPYLAGNVGTGSPQELCDWVEYVNGTIPTDIVAERQANGKSDPWGVKLWGVGNENWGCGGAFEAHDYGLHYRRFAESLRHVAGGLELVVCGFETQWNQVLVETLRGHMHLVDHFSIHRYWGGGKSLGFDSDGYYNVLRQAEATEAFVMETAEILRLATDRKVGVALDEWGVWAEEAVLDAKYEQPSTLRDAIAAAIAFEGFQRQASVLSMANLAQICNVLHAPVQTRGEHLWLTPTYYLLQMHAPHLGGTALRCVIEGGEDAATGVAALGATATRSETAVVVSLTNRRLEEPIEVRLAKPAPTLRTARLLAGPSADAHNGPEHDDVLPNALHWAEDGDAIVFALPPHSAATLTFLS